MPYSVREDISSGALAGFSAIELWWSKIEKFLLENHIDDLKNLLSTEVMKPIGICAGKVSPFRDTQMRRDQFARAVKAVSALQADMFAVTFDGQPARMTQAEAFAALAAELKDYAAIAAQHGVRICLEAVGRHSMVSGPRDCLELIDAIGAPVHVGLVMDTFHYFKSRVTSAEIDAIPMDRLFLVHVNDADDAVLDDLTDADRCFPTLGVIPLREQVSGLIARGYEGYFSVEVFRPSYWERPADDIAREAFEYGNALLRLLEQPSKHQHDR